MAEPTPDEILAERIAALLDRALSTLHRDETGARVFPIEDAAERLNMSSRTLAHWCREGLVDHTKIGRFRGLTARQIDIVAARHEQQGTDGPLPASSDEMHEAVQMSRKSAARRSVRSAA